MILPHTDFGILVLMAVSMFLLGSWANTYKLAGKWRFELYYFDFAFGVMLLAAVAALTVGNLGFDGFGLQDCIQNSGKQEWAFAFAAGALFFFGNMLLMAAMEAAGMMIAIPLALGAAQIVGAILHSSGTNLLFLGSGCVMLAVAMVLAALSHQTLVRLRHHALAVAGKAKTTRRPSGVKDVSLAVAGGILLGFMRPLLDKGAYTEVGLGPYAVWIFFGFGMIAMTVVGGSLLLNLSLQGDELTLAAFVRSRPAQHGLGVLGGVLWCAGAIAALVAVFANSAPGNNGGLPAGAAQANAFAMAALRPAAALVAALWGILAWKEAKDGDASVLATLALTLILFAGGVAMIALSGIR